MIRTLLLLPMLFMFAAQALDTQDAAPKIDFKRFAEEIKTLVLKEYPKAKITTEKFAKDFQALADRFGDYCEIRKDKN